MNQHVTKPRWLVTGARGFLGANLGLGLAGIAHTVGLVRTGAASNFHSTVIADLTDESALQAALAEAHPDVIVHAAAIAAHKECEADPDRAYAVNTRASEIIAREAARMGAHLIHISTDAVFDGGRGHYLPDDPVNPFSVYGRTKAEAEELVLRHGSPTVARANFFGWSPSGQRSILEFFVRNLRAGNRVKGFTDFTVTSAYAQDVCEYLWDIGSRRMPGVLHVTSPDALTKHEFALRVADAFELDAGLITPSSADVTPPRNRDLSLDVRKTERLLGRLLARQAEGIRRARADEAALRSALHLPA